ncbi:pseudouridine synthase [Asticcacaulis solisilvae]|uniref:pseudouridine synthase n=1 Tax=Asticcacaulis solisilvae TaxID=1217274 RepID=UPI003FD76E63
MSEDSNAGERDTPSMDGANTENGAENAKPAKDFKKGKGDKKPGKAPSKNSGERIAKVLARAGLASRREVERLIGLGQIAVNGRILDTPAVLVSQTDVITVDGKPIGKAEPTRLWRYHKPVGLMTTHKDPQGRPTVFEQLPQPLPRVISVGRLDINSEGLLLLTNDGELARALEMPSTAWIRVYRVRALGNTSQTELDRLKAGTTVEGVVYGPMEATLDKRQDKADGRANIWLTVSITEGKNREVRKVLESIGLKVNRLIRLAYGPFLLGNLESGEVEEVGPRVIREQLAHLIDPRNLPSETATQTRDAPRARSTAPAEGRRGGGDRFRKTDAREEKPRFKRNAGPGFDENREYKERDFDERPRFEGDGEARDRRPAPRFKAREGGYEKKPYGDKKPWTPRPERSGPGSDNGAPRREWKPRAEGSDRGEARDDRPARFKPRTEGGSRDGAPRREWKPRSEGDGNSERPAPRFKPRGDAAHGDRKPYGDKPYGEKKAYGEKRAWTPRPERSEDGAPRREWKPRAEGQDRGEGRGDRPAPRFKPRGEGGYDKKPYGDKKPWTPRGERPASADGEKREWKPRAEGGDRPARFKPRDDRSGGEKREWKPRPEGRPDSRRDDRAPRRDLDEAGAYERAKREFGGGEKKAFKPRAEGGDRPFRGKPAGKPGGFGGKPGGKPFGGKPGGFKPRRPTDS